ncbi:MAG: proton-conducting transporter membrane subunit [Alphaproteobacteria bacterium]
MLAITLNPGFVLILCALLLFVTPAQFRLPMIVAACAGALFLLLDRNFGAAGAVAQFGLPVVLLNLDALNQVFGIAFITATLLIAIYASARRHPFEDSAILLLAGGAVSALFVGDLISLVAAAELAGLAAVWTVFASPLRHSSESGARLMIWCGLEGLLFLIGVAFHLSAGGANGMAAHLDVRSPGGGFIFAALLIRAGAPGAHVWLKDTLSHASSAGAAAIAALSPMLGVYGLARLFPGVPLLLPIGEAMMVLGAFLAVGEDDLRRAGAYALTAQIGLCVALLGVASPLAQADVSAHAFATVFAVLLATMTQGMLLMRAGETRLSAAAGLARRMPATTAFMLIGGLAVVGAPFLAPYASLTLAAEASNRWETRWLWVLIYGVAGALAAPLVWRVIGNAFRRADKAGGMREAPFLTLLGAGLAAFFCVAIGLAPGWLYHLTPATTLDFDPYALDRMAAQLELLGSAGAVFCLIALLRLTPVERAVRQLDLDALYRGPLVDGGRWVGGAALRLYDVWRGLWLKGWARVGALTGLWARACDQPYRLRLASIAHFATIAALLAIILFMRP